MSESDSERGFVHVLGAFIIKYCSCPGTPIILLGCQSDRRPCSVETRAVTHPGVSTTDTVTHPGVSKTDTVTHPGVSKTDALAAGVAIGATAVMECSAKTGSNVKKVFDFAIRLALERRRCASGDHNQALTPHSQRCEKIPHLVPNVFREVFETTRDRLAYQHSIPFLLTMWKYLHLSRATGSTEASRVLHKQLMSNARTHPEGDPRTHSLTHAHTHTHSLTHSHTHISRTHTHTLTHSLTH